MKRTLLLLAVSALFFTSCKKCVECTDCAEGITLEQTEYCQDDFDSKDDYKEAVEFLEDLGCECK